MARASSRGFLPWVDLVSYSLYMWHEPLLLTLAGRGLLPEQAAASFIPTTAVLLVLSLFVAWSRTGSSSARRHISASSSVMHPLDNCRLSGDPLPEINSSCSAVRANSAAGSRDGSAPTTNRHRVAKRLDAGGGVALAGRAQLVLGQPGHRQVLRQDGDVAATQQEHPPRVEHDHRTLGWSRAGARSGQQALPGAHKSPPHVTRHPAAGECVQQWQRLAVPCATHPNIMRRHHAADQPRPSCGCGDDNAAMTQHWSCRRSCPTRKAPLLRRHTRLPPWTDRSLRPVASLASAALLRPHRRHPPRGSAVLLLLRKP